MNTNNNEKPFEIRVDTSACAPGSSVTVHVHHYHHYAEASPAPPASASSSATSSSPSPSEGEVFSHFVRLQLDASALADDGTVGAYLGYDSEGNATCNAASGSPMSIWEVREREPTADGRRCVSLQATALPADHHRRFLRVTAQGQVDCRGGGGRWTIFTLIEAQPGAGFSLRSLANAGKVNLTGSCDWFIALHEGKLVGNGGPFTMNVSRAPAVLQPEGRGHGRHGHGHWHGRRGHGQRGADEPQEHGHWHRHRGHWRGRFNAQGGADSGATANVDSSGASTEPQGHWRGRHGPHSHHHHHHHAENAPATDETAEEREARHAARAARWEEKQEWMAQRWEERKQQKQRSEAANKEAEGTAPSPSPAPAPAVAPATTAATTAGSSTAGSDGFPFGKIVSISPVAFAEVQNRKSTVGWHIGIAPMGFLVPDASAGGWSQLLAVAGPAGSVIFESVHTPAFHLAARKDGQLTHKGGRGRFAQFVPVQIKKKFWAFKNAGHDGDLYLACSPSGLLYCATELSKDVRFLVKSE